LWESKFLFIIFRVIFLLFITSTFFACGGGGGGSSTTSTSGESTQAPGSQEVFDSSRLSSFTFSSFSINSSKPYTLCQFDEAGNPVWTAKNIQINSQSLQKEINEKLGDKTTFKKVGRYLAIIDSKEGLMAFIDLKNLSESEIVITEEIKRLAKIVAPYINVECVLDKKVPANVIPLKPKEAKDISSATSFILSEEDKKYIKEIGLCTSTDPR